MFALNDIFTGTNFFIAIILCLIGMLCLSTPKKY